MTSISAGHIILTPTQPVGSGRPQRGSNSGPPDQESRALPTELPRPPKSYGEIWASSCIDLYPTSIHVIEISNFDLPTESPNA